MTAVALQPYGAAAGDGEASGARSKMICLERHCSKHPFWVIGSTNAAIAMDAARIPAIDPERRRNSPQSASAFLAARHRPHHCNR